jgi:hypothetical protein
MKHTLLEEVWRIRDQIGAECGHDIRRLAILVRREEARNRKCLVRVPASPTIRRNRSAVAAY